MEFICHTKLQLLYLPPPPLTRPTLRVRGSRFRLGIHGRDPSYFQGGGGSARTALASHCGMQLFRVLGRVPKEHFARAVKGSDGESHFGGVRVGGGYFQASQRISGQKISLSIVRLFIVLLAHLLVHSLMHLVINSFNPSFEKNPAWILFSLMRREWLVNCENSHR